MGALRCGIISSQLHSPVMFARLVVHETCCLGNRDDHSSPSKRLAAPLGRRLHGSAVVERPENILVLEATGALFRLKRGSQTASP